MSTTVETATDFHVDIPQDKIDDLRRRIAATRWPTKELVDDRSQGVQLATLKALATAPLGSKSASNGKWRFRSFANARCDQMPSTEIPKSCAP